MKEKDIHSLIEQQDTEIKQRVWERVSARIDLTSAPKRQMSNKKTWKWATIAVALVCIVTLSIVLPITLNGEEPSDRFCDESQYVLDNLGQTLREYANEHNVELLYVDWYDIAEDVTTNYGHMIENVNDIVFFEEFYMNSETGDGLTLSITDYKTQVDRFEYYYKGYEIVTIKDIDVLIKNQPRDYSYATFEYKNYKYYLKIDVGDGQARLTEIIEEMLK